jgi:hypothetical protein
LSSYWKAQSKKLNFSFNFLVGMLTASGTGTNFIFYPNTKPHTSDFFRGYLKRCAGVTVD